MSEVQQKLRALVGGEPRLAPLLSSHLEDYDDELLPTLFIAEIVDWIVEHRADAPDVGRHVLSWMNETYDGASEELKEVIATGGVEAIPNPGRPGAELRELLSSSLHAVDPWDERWVRQGTQASNTRGSSGSNDLDQP